MTAATFAFKVQRRPDFAYLSVTIPSGRVLRIAAGTVVTRTLGLEARERSVLGATAFQDWTAARGDAVAGLAPLHPGDVQHVALQGEELFLVEGAVLAMSPELAFASVGPGLWRCAGAGDIWFHGHGALLPLAVEGEALVRQAQLVFSGSLARTLETRGGYRLYRLRGRGRAWVQTRAPAGLRRWALFSKAERG